MNTTASLEWNLSTLGEWGGETAFEVTRERIAAYAAATNDEHADHVAGDLAPPVFAIVPAAEVLAPTIIGVVPPNLVMRGVHGQQDFRFHQAIRPGQTLTSRAVMLGVTARSSGAVVLGKAETRTDAGALVVEQFMTYFVRGVDFGETVGEPLPEHIFPDELRDGAPAATVTHRFDGDQTQRYSKASGDLNPIHLDDAIAKAVGLPGIIIHGLCTMAFCSRAVVGSFCPDDPTRLKRLAVRFAKVVEPSETITTTLWRAGEVDRDDRVVFETTSGNGNVPIKDGLAEIAP